MKGMVWLLLCLVLPRLKSAFSFLLFLFDGAELWAVAAIELRGGS